MVGPKLSVRTLCLIAVLSWPAPVWADMVVVPNVLATAEGNSNLRITNNIRFQQVYGSSQFSGLGVVEITSLAFRPDSGVGMAFPPLTLPDLLVRLSTTSREPDGLSVLFADNLGTDETVVFSGDWTRSSDDSPAAGGTRAFDIILPFTTPFTYDPANGNLLVDFLSPTTPQFVLITFADAHNEFGDSVSAINNFATSPTGFPVFESTGLVTQFTFQPAVVIPEPSSLVLTLVGAAGLLGFGWRWRKRAA